MRKFTVFVTGTIMTATILMTIGVTAANAQADGSIDAKEKVILWLLGDEVTTAVNEYYGEHRQYWRQEVLGVQKAEGSPYYEVAIQVETFCGAHNPPYGLDTMTFQVDSAGEVRLADYDHQNEAD